MPGALAATGELRVYNWSDYITPQALTDFKNQTGIKLTYDVFDTNEALEAKLLAGRSGYDVVVPSNTFLAKQVQAGVFLTLDRSKLPNWQYLDPTLMALLQENDPGNQHAIPYMYGTVILGYNVDKVQAVLGDSAPVDSWDLIFKQEYASKLAKCGIAFIDSPSDIIPIALNYLKLSPNSTKVADYEQAKALLLSVRPYIRYFHSSKYMNDIASGDICVAIGYSGSFYQFGNVAKDANNGVQVAMRQPKEGAPIWFDMLAIPKDAPDVDEAYQFINYLLQPAVIAPISDKTGYPNPNKEGIKQVKSEIRDNPDLVPSAANMARLFPLKPLPAKVERVRTRIWNTIKSGT
ncbi:polyamine ABC transporter substrate-binding protein [Aeromonas cavernicola]|nr:polyamine ABC transporter substrate-binding protein [Aeromonas cavernicola]